MNRAGKNEISDRDLDKRLARLEEQATHGTDLWPAIARRLDESTENSGRFHRLWVLAAGLMATAIVLVILQSGPGSPGEARTQLASQTKAEVIASSGQLLVGLDSPDFSRISPVLETGKTPDFSNEWATHRDAVEELENALEQHPDNGLLLDLMTRARLRELAIADQLWRI